MSDESNVAGASGHSFTDPAFAGEPHQGAGERPADPTSPAPDIQPVESSEVPSDDPRDLIPPKLAEATHALRSGQDVRQVLADLLEFILEYIK